jgi:GNAT superfamily N-acetyltransferase
MTVQVLPYASGDRSEVVSLVLGIQRGEFGVPITLDDQPDLADVPTHYQKAAGGFWVARIADPGSRDASSDAGEVVGTVGLLDHGGEGALRKMFVRADRRGRAHGVAPALLAALLAHARERGLARVRLGTRPEMKAAHRFYERNGFVQIEPGELPPSFPRMTFDSLFYRLDL